MRRCGCFFNLRSAGIGNPLWKRGASAVVMGLAIAGMHYTGMAATGFSPDSLCTVPSESVNNSWLALTIAGFTVMMLATTLIISLFDTHLVGRAAQHKDNRMQLTSSRA